jgi:serine/threonine-protein kinase
MSPEQIANPDAVDGRSDLYSLGAVGYHLLTGTPPFQGTSVAQVLGLHLHARPERPSERLGRTVPAELETLLLRCLEKEPSARPADAGAFIAELDACSGIEPWDGASAERWWRERGAELCRREPRAQDQGRDRRTLDVGVSRAEG